jgi:alcohol dehydrogenase class IV
MNIKRLSKQTSTVLSSFSLDTIESLIEPLDVQNPTIIIDQQLVHLETSHQKFPVKKIDFSLSQKQVIDSLKAIAMEEGFDTYIVIGDQKVINGMKLFLKDFSPTASFQPQLVIIPSSFITNNCSNGIVSTIEENQMTYYNLDSLIPSMTIIDESMIGQLSVEKKSLDMFALYCSLIDVLALSEVNSYQFHLCLEAFRLCSNSATSAAHSQREHESRQEVALASHLLSLARGQGRIGLLDIISSTISAVGNLNYSLVTTIIFPYMFSTLSRGNEETFKALYGYFNEEPYSHSKCTRWIFTTLNQLLTPIEQNLPNRLYDLHQSSSGEKALSISSLELIATIVSENRSICSYPTILSKQDIIWHLERAYWGYGEQEDQT